MPAMLNEIFKSYDVRGLVDTQLNPDLIESIAQALGLWLKNDGPVAVGYDMRPSSIPYKDAAIAGLISSGRDVIDIGRVSTDMMYFAVGELELAGGIMITASHNPASYNGLKISKELAKPVGLDGGLGEIRDMVASGVEAPNKSPGKVSSKDIYDQWFDHLLKFVDKDNLSQLSLVVDAGNGMMGEVWPRLQAYLKNLNYQELYFEPDGTFPNHEANPMKYETLGDLQKEVVSARADIGIAFDGDGDRVGMVDSKGNIISGSDIFMILSAAVLKSSPNAKIVNELRISKSALDYIEANGGTSIRTKVGNPAIKSAMRDNKAMLGGETTGHYVLADNYFIDSGLLAALMVIDYLVGNNIDAKEFIAKHRTYCQAEESNFEVSDKSAAINRLKEQFSQQDTDELDGLTVNFDSGAWFNVRPSNTEPLLRFNVEAKSQKEIDDISNQVRSILA